MAKSLFPSCKYWCSGLFFLEVIPSPKLHFHFSGKPVFLSVKTTVNGAFPEVGDAENAATDFAIPYFRYYDIYK